MTSHPHIEHLLACIDLEIQEQEKRYKLDEQVGLKQLRALGAVLHPLIITRKSFGYADYPEISFRLPFVVDTSVFRDNSSIECFVDGEEPVKGVMMGMEGQKGTFRLFAPDFPDWIEDKGVGIKLVPDQYTNEMMISAVKQIEDRPEMNTLFHQIHGERDFGKVVELGSTVSFNNPSLNESQKGAVKLVLEQEELLVVHGPPGTGKTTTLIESIYQLVKQGKSVLVTAPSNTAVDNVAKGLLDSDVSILRIGNSLKVDDAIFPHSPEGKMQEAKEQKEIKKLKIRAEELRKMSYQYKRHFGKAEREQRKLLMREVKRIRQEIKDIRTYFDEKLYNSAEVVLSTPIGLKNFLPEEALFDVLIMDEAGQMIEPLAWVVFPFAKSWVLAGDPFQLPPTVLSDRAVQKGFNVSILEQAFNHCQNSCFLDTQYRMRQSISDFSNQYFYKSQLKTPDLQTNSGEHVFFYDTAGTGFEEQSGNDGVSLMNKGELSIVPQLLAEHEISSKEVAFLSPYAGQIQLAKETLAKDIIISTIDSFQGQEHEVIVLSLVRSNPEAVIGFLKDYRRMNVAMTRAKERLFVIGDSSTIGQDPFYAQFLEFIESVNGYRSAWKLMS